MGGAAGTLCCGGDSEWVRRKQDSSEHPLKEEDTSAQGSRKLAGEVRQIEAEAEADGGRKDQTGSLAPDGEGRSGPCFCLIGLLIRSDNGCDLTLRTILLTLSCSRLPDRATWRNSLMLFIAC